MEFTEGTGLHVEVLDVLPNPVLVKDSETRYIWVNRAFERLFDVRREDLVGQLDVDVFKNRQAVQCNGGDLRVLASGEVDEAYETMFDPIAGPRETITRKSRLDLADGRRYLVGVMHDITDVTRINRELSTTKQLLESQADELYRLARTDPLTGCLNRRAMFDVARAEFAAFGGAGGLAVLDLDHFKTVNDRLGHVAGDAVLVGFVDIVRNVVRRTDSLARLGGEEFALLLPGASADDTQRIAQMVCEEIASQPIAYGGGSIPVTVSIGAVHAVDGFDLDQWLAQADALLYRAKSAGRNTVMLKTVQPVALPTA